MDKKQYMSKKKSNEYDGLMFAMILLAIGQFLLLLGRILKLIGF